MKILKHKDGRKENHHVKNLEVVEVDLPARHPKSRKKLMKGWRKETSKGIAVVPRPFKKARRAAGLHGKPSRPKTLKQLTDDLSKDLKKHAAVIEDLLADCTTVADTRKLCRLAHTAGSLKGIAEALKVWPHYFTEKK